MSKQAARQRELTMALKRFEDFTGAKGEVIGVADVPDLKDDDTLVIIGECEAIAYSAVRDGARASYQHEFKKSSRPTLAVSFDGSRLFLLAGAYKFTARGIEDK